MRVVIESARTASLGATLLSAGALLLIVMTVRYARRVPGYIVALLAGTVLVYLLHLPVETIGSRFGGGSSGFPLVLLPWFELQMGHTLPVPAITRARPGGT